MVASTTRSQLRQCLNDVDFPADKQDLLEAARRNGCDDDTVSVLRGIPPETYNNAGQVAASVTIADDRDTQGRAAARRTHTKPGLAESAKDVGVQSPIVEELGENRGS